MEVDTLVAGRYRPLELVGAGSMGQVWRAHDERLKRDVALKLLDLSAAPDAAVVERFRREAIATAQLNHPNIVSVFDAGADGDHAYLVMSLLPGRTIADLVRSGGPMPLEHALALAIQVTSALREAHRHGLVHRDVKPANVIVDGNQATVVDFGIAQLSDLQASLTATHAVIGSAAYMSPEHASGRRAGPASDLYGVGCLLMTMLTGRPPFTGDSAVAVAAQQVSADPPALSERIRTPRSLDLLVASLLAKDPAARPDAESALEQLREVQAHPMTDLVGPTARHDPLSTVVIPTPTAVLPASTAVLPAAQQWPPPSPGSLPSPYARTGAPHTPTPVTPQRTAAATARTPRRRRSIRPFVWLLVIALLGVGAFALGTQAGAITALTRTPLPASSARTTPSNPAASSSPSSSPASASAAPSATGTALALQLAVQGVSQVLAGLPAGKSKDRLVADWSTTGAAVLRGDHPNDQLDAFSARVQREVRSGGISIDQAWAILAAVGIVRAAL